MGHQDGAGGELSHRTMGWRNNPMLTNEQEKKLLAGLRKLAEARATCAMHVCNGDPHPSVPGTEDKNANAREWQRDCDKVEAGLEARAIKNGLAGVSYPGLYPTFETREGRTLYLS
jgi:hypothetical protein